MVDRDCDFTFAHYADCLRLAVDMGYEFSRCADLIGATTGDRTVVLRHDVDEAPDRAAKFAEIENALGIPATYFWRVSANGYNVFGYEVYSLIKDLQAAGHEIGLHAEPLDYESATGVPREQALELQLAIFRLLAGTDKPPGIASHRDQTRDNNLDFLSAVDPAAHGFAYEAYGREPLDLFHTAQYITDSLGRWRRFDRGVLTDDERCLCAQLADRRPLVYVLTHPHNWYGRHFHRVRY
ncbi:hypothetical protein [Nocardia niwae]|uniref:hypothetical protein n=1 Tax=Nocardia niwae TaxID=626084 RepID=UPI000A8A67F6|nr:hypothetical protein [Nocardia niwae]